MRGYDELIGRIFETVPPTVMFLILLAVTMLVAALWYYYPAWIPRRWPRLRLPRLRWPRFKKRQRKPRHSTPRAKKAKSRKKADVALPAVPGVLADQLAAEGRYAEAIRERLRDTVTDLTRAGVIDPDPGTTAAELTGTAATGRPVVAPALTTATGLFSSIWYGRQPATRSEDDRMRTLTAEVRAALNSQERR